jgi:hypothetical protein
MNSEVLTRILLEVAINGTAKNPQDNAEEAAMRTKLAAECAAIAAAGRTIDVPGEFE